MNGTVKKTQSFKNYVFSQACIEIFCFGLIFMDPPSATKTQLLPNVSLNLKQVTMHSNLKLKTKKWTFNR